MAVIAGACFVVFAAAVTVIVADVLEDSSRFPDEWDERLVDLVSFVEDERGLDFRHPVYVDFLTAEEFSARTTVDDGELTDEDWAALAEVTALFRAIGLVSGDFDPVSALNSLSDDGTLAYYDAEDKRITVRGTEITPSLSVTLVHELTHALQDQHFSLDRLMDMSGEEDLGFRALIEGDAQIVHSAYAAQLSDDDRAAYLADGEDEEVPESLDNVPEALMAYFAAPYILGEPFAMVIRGLGKSDSALEDPPSNSHQLLHPLHFERSGEPVDLTLPEPLEGVQVDRMDGADGDVDMLGAIDMFLMLAQRIDPVVALAAVDRWTGGAMRIETEADGRVCATMAVAVEEDIELVHAAFEAWRSAMPESAEATVTPGEERVDVRSCDPGAEAEGELEDRLIDALMVPALRNYTIGELVGAGAPTDFVDCMISAAWTQIPWSAYAELMPGWIETEPVDGPLSAAADACIA